MLDIILEQKEIKFNDLEKEIFRKYCCLACLFFKSVLESLDKVLMLKRDRKIYRHKGYKETTIKTIMGEVTFKRAVYEMKSDMGGTKLIYLLDQALGFEKIGLISSNLAEKIVENATVCSYRETAKNISELTGQKISHGGAWNVVQVIGKKIEEQEGKVVKEEKKEVKVLFEEADGVYLKLQGKDRKKYGKKEELKVAIVYEGCRRVGKKRWELVNKLACIGFEEPVKFFEKKERMIAAEYNVDEIVLRLLGGDGAKWIKQGMVDETEFQLCQFHKLKAVNTSTRDEKIRETIKGLLRNNKIDEALEYIDAIANSLEGIDDKAVEKLRDLYGYFSENKEGMVPYKQRKLGLPKSPEDIEYRNLGAMEPNIEQIITHRMKKKKASWSKNGAVNLGRILALKACKRLKPTIQNVFKVVLSENITREVKAVLSSAKVQKTVGKGKDGNIHKGKIPFRDSSVTVDRQEIKRIFDYVSFSNLVYR